MKKYQNGTFTIQNVNEKVLLFGWASKVRNLGGLLFIDLRDKSGVIQLVIKPEDKFYSIAEAIRNEFVLEVEGIIKERSSKNPNITTGEIEVEVTDLVILNEALPSPIQDNALEDTKLKYRYIDLRSDNIKNKLILRHDICMATRNYLDKEMFTEVETPILTKSTPEGARDYLVPSRVNKGKFYALPQSPQLFKQLLMVGGMERYFQIAKCFRDEDLRADRQPEFTQIDLEMSFVNEEDVQNITEGLLKAIVKKTKNIDIEIPFPRLKYVDAMARFGSDKPDTRFALEIKDLTNIFKDTEFSLFKDATFIGALLLENSNLSRKDIDNLTEFVKKHHAKGLGYLKFNNNEFSGSLKNLNNNELEAIKNQLNLKDDDLVLIIADKTLIAQNALGQLRNKLGKDLNLINTNLMNFLWVIDFPLFEYSEEDQRYYAAHHPFTSPKISDLEKLEKDPANCYARAYDIVLNGYEIGGGSIRIHQSEVQSKMFKALGFTKEEAESRFGFLLEAFKYGTPPHGGLALGLDRITMLLSGTDNIRDVIAFPKTASATCLMTDAPDFVSEKQLEELSIKTLE